MSESIASIHLCDLQSTPPFHHLSNDSFAFPDSLALLVLLVDPVDITDTDTRKVTRLWPSSLPLFTFKEHSHLQACKDHIIELLKHGRNRKLRNGLQTASALTHNQYTKIFPEETSILDYLLMSISACTTYAKDIVYKLDENIYQEFLTRLTTCCSLASASLETFGYSDLRPPVWAIDTGKGLTANNFEMYALQYCIRRENFLYMLDDVHDWDKLQMRIYLDERLLSAQHNADRAHLGKMEYHCSAVPPVPHSNPLKSKTSCHTSASDWRCRGAHYEATRDMGQHPNNSWVAETQGQPYCQVSCHSHTPGLGNNEHKGNHSDVKLKMMNAPTRDSSPETSVRCEGKPDEISTPSEVLNHNVSRNKTFRLPHRVRRRISQLLKWLQRVFHITSWVTSTNGEKTWVQLGMNTFDRDALKPVPDLGSYITSNSQKALVMLSAQPKVHIKQKTNFREQTGASIVPLEGLYLPASKPSTNAWRGSQQTLRDTSGVQYQYTY
ncbi:hypothetical protein ARMGADRAFT_1144451 [Armillaria gallica]|uniref:Uncharacterized protein n=1 Tax=Armillaria gallica TaxID=47427 RepID=A0A2H3CHM5_ARMGA|nr:hypothetical protein ARMGADRAFT_1144451 [Armillaria gallica]